MPASYPAIAALGCAVSCDTAIFLDIADDRYFALKAAENAIMVRLLAGASASADERAALDAAIGFDVVRALALGHLVHPRRPSPTTSLFENLGANSNHLGVARAVAGIDWCRIRVAVAGLRTVTRLSPSRTLRRVAPSHATVVALASIHRRAERWASAHGNCLSHSLALTIALSRKGVASELVIGVKTMPFAAHSWVQIDGCVLNDRVERVQPFTPIAIFP